MIRFGAILFACCLSAKAVLVVPTQEQQDQTNSWSLLATGLNTSGAVTNPAGYSDRGGYGYILRTTPGDPAGFLTAIGSNKVAWASHIGILVGTQLRYESDKAASPTYYTITSTANNGVDLSISTVTPNLPLWVSVNTNYAGGQNAIAWGTGRSYDPTGSVTTNTGIRRFPLRDDPGTVRWAPCRLWGPWFGGVADYRVYANDAPELGVTYGDSSGPTFTTNGAIKFVGNWSASDAGSNLYINEDNLARLNGTWNNTGFIVGQLGDDLNGGTNAPAGGSSPAVPNLNVQVLRIGSP